jgi:uncharacterized protein (DUF2384 family)
MNRPCSAQRRGERLELVAAEQLLAIVALAAEVGRVEIEQRLRPVVAVDERRPVELLDDDAGKALVDVLQERSQRGQVEACR